MTTWPSWPSAAKTNIFGAHRAVVILCLIWPLAAAFSLRARAGSTSVVAWGLNNTGQTNVPANLTNACQIDGGYTHSLALKDDGVVVVWGYALLGSVNVPAGLSNVVTIAAGCD